VRGQEHQQVPGARAQSAGHLPAAGLHHRQAEHLQPDRAGRLRRGRFGWDGGRRGPLAAAGAIWSRVVLGLFGGLAVLVGSGAAGGQRAQQVSGLVRRQAGQPGVGRRPIRRAAGYGGDLLVRVDLHGGSIR